MGMTRRPALSLLCPHTLPAMELELTHCPDCGLPAEVIGRATLPSTDGPMEHVKTRCITGHWYMTPIDYPGPFRAR
jgi:hypothetical protein